jgi:hypothetical protein
MDLSPAAPRAAADPLRRLWGAITVRVAWDLLRAGVQVRPATLRAGRDHALWRMPAGAITTGEAEAVASAAVDDYLARCAGRYAAFTRDPDLAIPARPAWRETICTLADPIHEAVFRLHYADGLPLEEVERRTGLEAALLRGAREAVRELARTVVADAGPDAPAVDGWDPARLDRLIGRIATAAGDLCPGPGGLVTDAGRAHADGCPRCSRALRLLREGILTQGDLFPPEDGACLPKVTLDLACIHVHPDARRHLRPLLKALGAAVRPLPADILLVDAAAVDLEALLVDAAERGAPPAAQLRVVRRQVPGRWTPRAVLGPSPEELLTATAALAWGDVVGIAPLPEPLPPPPSAARLWVGAGLVALLAVAAAAAALPRDRAPALVSLDAQGTAASVVFDTDDSAWVDILAVHGPRAELLFESASPGDKGALGTGDGRYTLAAGPGTDAIVVVASPTRIEGLDRVLQGLPDGDDSVGALVERLRDRYTGAAVAAVP